MSSSSLWGIDKNFVGKVLAEYKNSWLFCPIVWDVLSEKYCPLDIMTPYGFKKHIIGDQDLWLKVNNELNESLITSDRVCWELSNHQVFFTRDTHYADYLETFEGINLPVSHCIENTEGWQISKELPFNDEQCFIQNKRWELG